VAGSGNDTLSSNSGPSSLYGGSGHDFMALGSGNSVVYGGTGADTVNTSTGNDTIFGGNSTTVNSSNTQASIASQTVVGGVTQIVFGDGQQLASRNVTLNFTGGGTIHT
jgi:Ca2+-binding RTX toxin-like protein